MQNELLIKNAEAVELQKEMFFFFIVSYFMLQEEITLAERNYLLFLLYESEIIQLSGHDQRNNHQY